jgi:hypothetical protein
LCTVFARSLTRLIVGLVHRRFETEDEARLAYDQAVRTLKLEKSLNYPSTAQEYFSPDVARKVQTFMDKHAEPSNSCSSSPRAPAGQLVQSPAASGNSTASGEPSGSVHGPHARVCEEFMQLPSDEYQADFHHPFRQTAENEAQAAAAQGHRDCMSLMQLPAQVLDCSSSGAVGMLLPGQLCAPWEQLALQLGASDGYEQMQYASLAGGAQFVGAPDRLEQERQQLDAALLQHEPTDEGLQEHEQTDQGLQEQPLHPDDAPPDDVRVMLSLLAEILAEDQLQESGAQEPAAAMPEHQLQHDPYVHDQHTLEQEPCPQGQHRLQGEPCLQKEQCYQGHHCMEQQQHYEDCSGGYVAALTSAMYLQAGPAGSPSTPVMHDSPAVSVAQQPAASAVRQHAQQQFMPAASTHDRVPLQQAPLMPSLSSCGEVVLFVDVTTKRMLQLYTQLTANNMQHAGLTAIQWMSDVRLGLTAPGYSTPGSSPEIAGECSSLNGAGLPYAVQAAVLHTCSSLVAVAAGGSADMAGGLAGSSSFSSCFLVAVLEQAMKVLMALRGLCAGLCPSLGLNSSMLQAFQGQLQAHASTQVGQAVAAVLGWVLMG